MIQPIRDELNARKGQWPLIAKECNVSYSWLTKFAQGHINNPTIDHLMAVDEYLKSHARKPAA